MKQREEEKYRQVKVCLLGATFGTGNMGVSALTAGAIKCILRQSPDPEIVLLDYGKERVIYHLDTDNQRVPIRLLNMRFSKKIYLKNNIGVLILLSLITRLVPFNVLKRRIISGNPYLGTVWESDIVAAISGGDSFSDIYGMGRFLYVSLPQMLVLFLGKKLILLPQTLGPFSGRVTRVIARYILNHASKVYSRDYAGMKEVQTFLESKDDKGKLKFCYDVGFVVDPVKPIKLDVGDLLKKRKDGSCMVGLNISGLLFMGGYTRDNMFGLRVNYESLILDLIEFAMSKENTTVLLVPHVFGKGRASESDSIVCERMYKRLRALYDGRLFLVRGRYNQNEIKHIIGLCDFFIGSRMHACIAALSQEIPAVGIAYSKKFYGVMESIGFGCLVADPRKMDKEEIMLVVSGAFERRNELRKQLAIKMVEVRQRVLSLFSDPDVFS